MAHHEQYYTLGLNQNTFGAAYYVSALIHLIRGGADMEMRWTATAHERDAYGLMTMRGEPTPAGLAKQMFAQHVRYGDCIRFPAGRLEDPDVDAIVAWDETGRFSGVFVNTASQPRELRLAEWDGGLAACEEMLRLDMGTGGRVVRSRRGEMIRLEGYGIAVVTNQAADLGVA